MLERVLLLCDEVERPFLTDTLRASAGTVEIQHIREGRRPDQNWQGRAGRQSRRSASFGPSLPAAILAGLGHGAYNFHPGPPNYPGWMPSSFAVYEGATEFGATAHSVSAAQDGGAIIGVDTFPLAAGMTPAELWRRAPICRCWGCSAVSPRP